MRYLNGLTASLILALTSSAFAQERTPVRLGSTGVTTINGKVTGDDFIDYVVPVGAGQSLAVTLRGTDPKVVPYFNINLPNSDDALYIGSVNGNSFQPRMMPNTGKYIIRVYQMGDAKDSGVSTKFTLGVRVTGQTLPPSAPSSDLRVKGKDFHGTSTIECKIDGKPNLKRAEATVIRRGNGSATIIITAGTITRTLLFVHGKLRAHDSRESFTVTTDVDELIVRFGDRPSEEYTVHEGMVFGG